jgi:hypothetical protein
MQRKEIDLRYRQRLAKSSGHRKVRECAERKVVHIIAYITTT